MRHDAPICAALRLRVGAVSAPRFPLHVAFRAAAPKRSQLPASTLLATNLLAPSTARYSSSSSSPSPQRATPQQPAQSYSPTPNRAAAPIPLSRDAANPPASTRPPPLDTPVREATTSLFQHLFSTGKAYLTFYKTGLKQIYTNGRMLYPPATDPPPAPAPGTRAALLLRARWGHDARRVPVFALLVLVCGEFTPFVVLAVPSIVPLTCRIPKQTAKMQRDAEARRARAREEFHFHLLRLGAHGAEVVPTVDVAAGYLARTLAVVGSLWDRLGVTMPASVVGGRVRARLAFLREDDRLLVQAGGVQALEGDEVTLACEDRGIRVVGRGEKELRPVLARWLRLVGGERLDEGEREARMVQLLLSEEGEWPTF